MIPTKESWSLLLVTWAVLAATDATPLPFPSSLRDALMNALGVPADSALHVDLRQRDLGDDLAARAPTTPFVLEDAVAEPLDAADELEATADIAEAPTRQLSPSTQSFLGTLGTALGPIVGAIVGPLLSNIGQNLSAGSGAQAIAQLQQAAQAAQQQGGAVESSTAGTPSPSRPPTVSVTPPPRPHQHKRPRPVGRPARPTRPAPLPRPQQQQQQSFDAFMLDLPGKGPFLFLMAPNRTADEQSAAIQQAQQHAALLLGASGGVSSTARPTPTPGPQVTKPTSVGPLPVRPGGAPAAFVTPAPLPSYHKGLDLNALQDPEQEEQGEEEVAVAEEGEDLGKEAPASNLGKDYASDDPFPELFPQIM